MHFLKFCFTLLVLAVIFSCQDKVADQVSIQFQTSPLGKSTTKLLKTDLIKYADSILATTQLDGQGAGNLSFIAKKAGLHKLEIDENFFDLYFTPGAQMEVKPQIIEGQIQLHFSGDGANVNNFLGFTSKALNHFFQSHPIWFRLPIKDFKEALMALEGEINTTFKRQQDSVSFTLQEKQLIEDYISVNLLNLEQQHQLINQEQYEQLSQKTKQRELVLSEKLLALTHLEYAQVLDLYLRSNFQETPSLFSYFQVEEENKLHFTDSLLRTKNYPKPILSYMLAKNLSYWLSVQGLKPSFRQAYEVYQKDFPHSNYLLTLSKEYEDWLQLDKGEVSPAIAGVTKKGDTIQIESLKGKLVYIDVWASWCAPCLEEFPHYDDLKQNLRKPDEVAFVFISVDKDENKWLEKLADSAIPTGIHLLEKEGIADTPIQQAFKMWGVPHYILLDKEGKIIDAHAPRPSSAKLSELINRYL